MNTWPLKAISKAYNLNILHTTLNENVIYLHTTCGDFALKRSRLLPQELEFEFKICQHLWQRGFNDMASVVPTVEGEAFASHTSGNYFLTTLLNGVHADFSNTRHLDLAVRALANFHLAANGFSDTVPWPKRLIYGTWPQRFSFRLGHILWYCKCIEAHGIRDEFDQLFLEQCSSEIIDAVAAIDALRSPVYYTLAAQARSEGTICHHDYTYHNLIINDSEQVSLIDFDYCILDNHLHDLASLIWRVAKLTTWSFSNIPRILLIYDDVKVLSPKQLSVLAEFLSFPQDLWQLGWAKYSEVNLHSDEALLLRLKKLAATTDARRDFVQQLKELSRCENFLPGRDSL